MSYYSVSIETWGPVPRDLAGPAALEDLIGALEHFGASGASVSTGGPAGGGMGATFGVEEFGPPIMAFADVSRRGVETFISACEKLGYEANIAAVEVVTDDYLAFDNEREPEEYAGVSELAETLNVSRQRVSELRTRQDFPAPIAELAAGPVWKMSSLRRFIGSWDRKPGRPRKVPSG